jgi:hypothetical protein
LQRAEEFAGQAIAAAEATPRPDRLTRAEFRAWLDQMRDAAPLSLVSPPALASKMEHCRARSPGGFNSAR